MNKKRVSKFSTLVDQMAKQFIDKTRHRKQVRMSRMYTRISRQLPRFNGIYFVDVGAAWGLNERWGRIESMLHYRGFEPDDRTRAMLHQNGERYASNLLYPFALSSKDKKPIQFNLCRDPGVSSCLQPNRSFLDNFPRRERFDILNVKEIESSTLDSVLDGRVDFIKLDTQGTELEILKGGLGTIRKTFGIEIEVEFTELYKDQALFGDASNFLISQGFEFIDFVNLQRWERNSLSGYGQCVFGDALFLRSPECFIKSEYLEEKTASYLMCLLIYKRFDLLARTLALLQTEKRNEFRAFQLSTVELEKRYESSKRLNRYFSGVSSLVCDLSRSFMIY